MQTFLLAVAVVLCGCTKHNPDSCCSTAEQCSTLGIDGITGCLSGKACDPTGTCIAAQCTTSADCTMAEAPICENQLCVAKCVSDSECVGLAGRPLCASDGVCVGCVGNTSCTSSDAPICDMTERSCRGCSADVECPSAVCIESTGTCAVTDEVIHIAYYGSDSSDCTAVAPCASFAAALQKLTAARDVIKVDTQTLTPAPTVSLTGKRVIIDGKDTTLTSTSGSVFNVGIGGVVTLEEVTISAGSDTALSIAGGIVRMYEAGITNIAALPAVHITSGSLTINRGTLVGPNQSYDVVACETGGVLSISSSTLTNTHISSSNCTFSLKQNTFTSAFDGGFVATGGQVQIENNLVINGGQYPDVAALNSLLPGSRLRFNTFVDYYTAGDRGGSTLICDSSVEVVSNIFATGQNAINGCVARYSLFDDNRAFTLAAGTNNLLTDLTAIFVSPSDFHLSTTSPARDKGEPGTDIGVDLDGAPRPATPDIGAYEAP